MVDRILCHINIFGIVPKVKIWYTKTKNGKDQKRRTNIRKIDFFYSVDGDSCVWPFLQIGWIGGTGKRVRK